MIGCAIARELAVRGVRCTVIDSRPIGGGATQASAGMLAPYVEAHDTGPMLDLCVRSLTMYDGWIAGLRVEGARIDYERMATLEVALAAEQAARLRHGMMGRWLEPSAVASRYPQIAPSFGAFAIDAHGYVDPPQLTSALAASARRRGVMFRSGRVDAIARAADGLEVRIDGRAQRAATVVLSAGAWSNQIEGVTSPPIRPVRGQLLTMRWAPPPLPAIVWGPDCYIVPRYDGRTILVGATVEEAGFEERTTEEGVRGLLDAAQRLLPGLRDTDLIEARVGLRPATPDELPALGRDPWLPDLIHASGHYRNGVLLAPITGTLIADLVLGEPEDPALRFFRTDRFSPAENPSRRRPDR